MIRTRLWVAAPCSEALSANRRSFFRYHANAALDSIHRSVAVELWSRYQGQSSSFAGLDTALGAFDMFVLHDQEQDLEYVRLGPNVRPSSVTDVCC